MMYAGMMAGMAFNNAGLGFVHSLSHQLGGFYSHMHGAYNAVLLPYVLDFNAVSIPEGRILKICEAMGMQAKSKTQAVDKIIDALNKLRTDICITDNLRQMGLEEEDIETLAQNALKDLTVMTNPRQADIEDFIVILKAAM